MARTLVGAVAYRTLRDHSAPFTVLERLETSLADPAVVIEDVSYNPIAVVQWLQEQRDDARFDRVVLVAALERGGRAPGSVSTYRWDGILPPDDLVQQAVTDAVTGIIAVENTVIVAGYFRALPSEVAIVEIEPRDHAFGFELSPAVAAAIEPACAIVARLAADRAAFDGLPSAPLRSRAEMSVGAR